MTAQTPAETPETNAEAVVAEAPVATEAAVVAEAPAAAPAEPLPEVVKLSFATRRVVVGSEVKGAYYEARANQAARSEKRWNEVADFATKRATAAGGRKNARNAVAAQAEATADAARELQKTHNETVAQLAAAAEADAAAVAEAFEVKRAAAAASVDAAIADLAATTAAVPVAKKAVQAEKAAHGGLVVEQIAAIADARAPHSAAAADAKSNLKAAARALGKPAPAAEKQGAEIG